MEKLNFLKKNHKRPAPENLKKIKKLLKKTPRQKKKQNPQVTTKNLYLKNLTLVFFRRGKLTI